MKSVGMVASLSLLLSGVASAQSKAPEVLRLYPPMDRILIMEQAGTCSETGGDQGWEFNYTRRLWWAPVQQLHTDQFARGIRAIVSGITGYKDLSFPNNGQTTPIAPAAGALVQLEIEVKAKEAGPEIAADITTVAVPLEAAGRYSKATGNTYWDGERESAEIVDVNVNGDAALTSFVSPGRTDGKTKSILIFADAFDPARYCKDPTATDPQTVGQCFTSFLATQAGSNSSVTYAKLLLGWSPTSAREKQECDVPTAEFSRDFRGTLQPNDNQGRYAKFSGYYVDKELNVVLQAADGSVQVKLTPEE